MREISLLRDAPFLRKLDVENIKVHYAKIIVLDKNENPLRAIEGRVSTGSITINGNSAVRRAGSLTFLAEETENDLTDIDNLLSMNKKIRIMMGIENHIDSKYDDIIWFPLGIFIISNPSLTHNTTGVKISIQFKDKMCLLNGESGGNLPTSITFDSYDQVIGSQLNLLEFPKQPNDYTVYEVNKEYYMWDLGSGWHVVPANKIGSTVNKKQKIFDIIQTLVCNYGGESLNKIIINDVPLEIKNAIRYTGKDSLYYNLNTSTYTTDSSIVNSEDWIKFNTNEECGYTNTDFTYPGSLVSSIGENVVSVLEKIKKTLGNYEYFYDINGNFVFQEIKNYLNNTYNPVYSENKEYKLTLDGYILDKDNYKMDLSNRNKSVYTFEQGNTLISSYSNTPNYTNIKNDFHVWGKNEKGNVIHYHIVVKDKPIKQEQYGEDGVLSFPKWKVVFETQLNGNEKIRLPEEDEEGEEYIPEDWRAQLYLEGLQKKQLQQRLDIYEQELIDMFDSIYDMKNKKFRTDVNNANILNYWIDYISNSDLKDISVDVVGTKIYSYQQDEITKLYNSEIPNTIMISESLNKEAQQEIIDRCYEENQNFSRVPKEIYDNTSIGLNGLSAQSVARDLINQYTEFNSNITLTSMPIYYLEANTRITVQDRASGIYGDYVINSIRLPLDTKGTMSISASRAIDKI